jgi:hypothetical protein
MKKTLITMLTLILVLSFAGTVLAAPANPFVDVPAKHWSYDAVSKLAKAGVVDGYNDGTFQGDKTMTRYEMAQIVAKAMAKSEKADAESKALIEKLAKEYAAELDNLGVRVTKLEEKTNFKFNGEMRFRMLGDSPEDSSTKIKGTQAFDWRARFHVNADVNNSTSFTARLEAKGNKFGQVDSTQNDLKFNRMFFTTKNVLGLDKVTYGRQGIAFGNNLLGYKSSDNDGVVIDSKMGNIAFKAGVLDVKNPGASPSNDWNANEFTFANFGIPLDKTVDLNLAYYRSTIAGTGFTGTTGVDVGTNVKIGDFTLTGEYVKSNLGDATAAVTNKNPKAYALQLTNGLNYKVFYPGVTFMVDVKKPGTDAWALAYYNIQNNSIPDGLGAFNKSAVNSAGDISANNTKGYYITYQNVVAKNIVFSFEYQDIKNQDTGTQKDKTYQGHFQFVF